MATLGAPVLVLSKLAAIAARHPLICVPFIALDSNTKRETGRKAQLGNIEAAKVSGIRIVRVAEPLWVGTGQ